MHQVIELIIEKMPIEKSGGLGIFGRIDKFIADYINAPDVNYENDADDESGQDSASTDEITHFPAGYFFNRSNTSTKDAGLSIPIKGHGNLEMDYCIPGGRWSFEHFLNSKKYGKVFRKFTEEYERRSITKRGPGDTIFSAMVAASIRDAMLYEMFWKKTFPSISDSGDEGALADIYRGLEILYSADDYSEPLTISRPQQMIICPASQLLPELSASYFMTESGDVLAENTIYTPSQIPGERGTYKDYLPTLELALKVFNIQDPSRFLVVTLDAHS